MWALVLAAALAADAEHGALLADAAGCASCHTAPTGEPYAGGYAIETRYGTFYGPNITPGGLVGFDEARFRDALRGRSPEGHRYYPAFPWPAYRDLTDADISDVWAYLSTLPASNQPNRPHALRGVYRWRGVLALWRPTTPPTPSPGTERGAYLANALFHCSECHTPRTATGQPRRTRWLGGNPAPPEPAPNLRDLDWSASDWDAFLTVAMTANGDYLGGQMGRIVEEGTSRLSVADRAALIAYLTAIP
jgi:mono/diheme cytochrome c family protein